MFFDPGRQKRGILPNQQMGRSLEPGQRYTLVVDREWRDGNGLPLKEVVHGASSASARPTSGRSTSRSGSVAPPRAGTRDPLVVDVS